MTKFQDENQLKGRFGELLAAFVFPAEWVVRPIAHDFGLDLQVEVFTPVPTEGGRRKYQTWGEHIYLQVKTTDKLTYSTVNSDDQVIDVLNFPVDTSELKLVEAMGASVPVVLLVVNRTEMTVFYVCLNDYISKMLATNTPKWRDQGSVTLKIPVCNQIRVADEEFDPSDHWGYFARLAKRSKFYSAANLLHHYSVELRYPLEMLDETSPRFSTFAIEYTQKLRAFTDEIAHLDIWRQANDEWGALGLYRETLDKLGELIEDLDACLVRMDARAGNAEELEEAAFHFIRKAQFANGAFETIATLGRGYEDIVRWERLPGKLPLQGVPMTD